MKNGIFYLFLTAFWVQMFGCIGKKEDTFLNSNASVEVLSGANQTAIIGNLLPQNVKLKVLKDGQVSLSAFVMFQWTNCNGTKLIKVPVDRNGIAEFMWRLDDRLGEQTLTYFAYVDNVPIETQTIKAIATNYDKNIFNRAACLDSLDYANYDLITSDKKNIWAFNDLNRKIFLSKNSGRSWQNVLEFTTTSQQFKSLKNGDIYWLKNDTLFFSKDFGKTQQFKKVSEIKQFSNPPSLQVTNSGKILLHSTDITTTNSGFVSSDGGTSWVKFSGITSIVQLEELSNGRMLCTGYNHSATQINTFFYSDDKGITWKPVWSTLGNNDLQLSRVDQLFISSTGEIYTFATRYNYFQYKSTDLGNSWVFKQQVLSSFNNIQEYNNEFYYLGDSYNLLKTTNFVGGQVAFTPFGGHSIRSYFFSADNFIVCSTRNNVYFKPL